MSGSSKKQLAGLFRLMKKRGFEVQDKTGRKHHKFRVQCPSGCEFLWVLASTPSDRRSWREACSTLRRNLEQCGYVDERAYLKLTSELKRDKQIDDIFACIDGLARQDDITSSG